VPVALAIGLTILVLNHRGTRRFLSWWKSRQVS